MSTQLECPGCGKRYKVGDDLAGQRVWCGCGRTLIADDLLDETIWRAESEVKRPAETTQGNVNRSPFSKPALVVPAVPDDRPRSPPTDNRKDEAAAHEPDTFWTWVQSLNRELVAWLAVAYGIWMLIVSLALVTQVGLTFSLLLILALSPLVIVGGLLIRKRHSLGPLFSGMGSAGITFFVFFQTVTSGFSPGVLVVIFVVQFVFFYSVPAYIIYWCLKEEEAVEEAARRDDFYVIRESLKDRMMEENRKEWESK